MMTSMFRAKISKRKNLPKRESPMRNKLPGNLIWESEVSRYVSFDIGIRVKFTEENKLEKKLDEWKYGADNKLAKK